MQSGVTFKTWSQFELVLSNVCELLVVDYIAIAHSPGIWGPICYSPSDIIYATWHSGVFMNRQGFRLTFKVSEHPRTGQPVVDRLADLGC
jgi:hypothetical protein